MTRERVSMRKIKEVLRLKFEFKRSNREIGRCAGISYNTVSEYLKRAESAELSWPLPEELDDAQLEERLFPTKKIIPSEEYAIDFRHVHREMKRKGVTLMLLWSEYKERYPQGFSYAYYCMLYRAFTGKLETWMRQTHKAGERMFVDYAGMTMPVLFDVATGEMRDAQIFIAVLGASGYAYVEATWTQELPNWIESHIRAFEFFGGVPELIVPDNLKSGVTQSHRYDPDVNQTYQEMAHHYNTAIFPARARTPKDKAKAEQMVKQTEQQILAPLRNQTFLSLFDLNHWGIKPKLNTLNNKSFQKMPGSRFSQFEELDKPALKPLSATRYVFGKWIKAKAGPDYHVSVEGHFYSVPYTLIKQPLDVRLASHTVEIFHKSKRVALHQRNHHARKHTTVKEHMPQSHQHYADWTPERIIKVAAKTGEKTAALVAAVIADRPHPQQAFRACLGILRLGKRYGEERLESACARALTIGAIRYKSIESILKNGLDRQPLPNTETKTPPVTSQSHEHVRGSDYFN